MLSREDKKYINESLDNRFADFEKIIDKRFIDFEKKIDKKFSNLIDHMNDQFSRILGYVEQIDKRLEKVEKTNFPNSRRAGTARSQ